MQLLELGFRDRSPVLEEGLRTARELGTRRRIKWTRRPEAWYWPQRQRVLRGEQLLVGERTSANKQEVLRTLPNRGSHLSAFAVTTVTAIITLT